MFMRSLKKLFKAQAGIAYVEFAITLPFLVMLFLGAVEITRYIIIIQKVEKVSVTISDLVAQSSTTTNADLAIIVQAASQVMRPFTFNSNAYVIISSVTKTGTNTPKVNWQYTGGGTWTQASGVGTTNNNATLPTGFTMVDKDNIIITEVYYNYTPLMGSVLHNVIGGGTLYKQAVFKPRLGDLTTISSWLITLWKGAFA